jgi:hypothetical protein
MARELLPYAVLFVLLLLAAYVYYLAFRSRESELRQALRKCEIALQDCERSRQNAAALHAAEARRLKTALNDVRPADGAETGEPKFRDAKSAFARLFHPDTVRGDAREREIRTDIFKQFWEVLERIDRRG